MRITEDHDIRRVRLLALGTGLVAAVLGALFLAFLPGSPSAAPTVAPNNTAEPRLTGTPRVGQIQSTTRGTWTGTQPIAYVYRWFRCEGRGAADASDCLRIQNAADTTYVARQGDVGFRLRSQVIGTNADGSDTATSNPSAVIQPAPSVRPANTTEPSISGTPTVGQRLTANRGAWSGQAPITYAYQWLRCSQTGDNCGEISGASDTQYLVVAGDAGRTLRVRVTARNDNGSRSALSNETAVVGGQTQPPPPPAGNSVNAEDLRAAGDRLVVSQVRFSPNPVTSNTAPIVARVRVTDQRGRAVRGALVFVRATPRVVRGDRLATQADGWVSIQLIPNQFFPQPRNNFNVQFFVKAYRASDPALGGIAGYRLVQVRLANA
ncbi:MAG: hypothetical protein H0U46_11045 [Actinobacteria bacterium]|nr:hypothetical protein [Actinomycetota bacterium]